MVLMWNTEFKIIEAQFFKVFISVRGVDGKLHADFVLLYFLNFIYNNSAICNKMIYIRVSIVQQKENENSRDLCAWSQMCFLAFSHRVW
jgi:hypothetical protein